MDRILRKITRPLLIVAMLLIGGMSFGQIVFTSVPDSVAALNTVYTYNVVTVHAPDNPVYSLQAAPSWMSINPSTGVVTGTPTLMSQGGPVIIKAHNSNMDNYQGFNIYMTDEVVCDPAIVSYWPMDNKEGHIIPDFANGHDADWSGATQPEPTISSTSVTGNSVLFAPTNGDDEFYHVADQEPFQFQYNEDFSVSFWFKNNPSDYTTNYYGEVMIGRNTSSGAKWYIRWDPTVKKIQFYLQEGSTDDTLAVNSTVISDNNWHHVVATFNSVQGDFNSYIFLYVDNVSKLVMHDFYTDNFYGTGELNIGWLSNWGQSYSGYLDEIVYYNKELTPTEVTTLYNKGIAHQSVCSPGNIAPVITSTPITSVNEYSAYSYKFNYKEIDGDPVTLSAPVLPSWLAFNTSTGVLSGTPSFNNVGNHNVTLSVSDGEVQIDQVFVIDVVNVNDLPVVSSTAITSIEEDAPYSYTIVATDADAGSTLTYSATLLPAWMSFNTSTQVLSGTPGNDLVGLNPSADFDVTLRVTDNTGASVDQSFVVTVNQVNDSPVVNSQNSLSVDEDNSLAVSMDDLNVTDVDNTFPDDFGMTVKNGNNYTHVGNSITPAENWNGTLTVPVDLSDGTATISYDLIVTVNPVNDAPEFASEAVLDAEVAVEYQYWINTSDVEGNTLTLTCTSKPEWLDFTSNAGNGLLQGTPGNGDAGTASVTLRVSDGSGQADQTFSIEVVGETGINDNTSLVSMIYPVPARDFVTFSFATKLNKASLEIYTIDGALVKKLDVSFRESFKLDVSDLQPSQYIYRISTPEGNQTGPLVIE